MADVAADWRALSGRRVRRPHAFAALTAVLAAAALAVLAAFRPVFAHGEARDCRNLKHLLSRAREAQGETWRASGICGLGGAWLVPGAAA